MRIGMDACCWSNRRGFGRFTRELGRRLVELTADSSDDLVLVVDQATAATETFPDAARLEVAATAVQPTRAAAADGARSPLDLWRMRRAAVRLDPDVFFFPAVYTFFPVPRRIPTVVTFHDAIAEQHGELIFPNRRARLFWDVKTRLALRHADRLLTVSESARRQITEAFGVPAEQVTVTSEGPSDVFRPRDDPAEIDRVRERHGLPADRPLVLYVGGISPHKNLAGLVEALSRVGPAQPWHLVLVGDYQGDSFFGCFPELRDRSAELGLETRITFTGFVPDDDLALLYNAATLLVLPSFSEGFGLPVVEAMASGLPVAASRAGSLPEVLGDAGELFDPTDPDDMATVLGRLLGDEGRRRRLRERGLVRARDFAWEKTAADVLELLREAAGQRRRR